MTLSSLAVTGATGFIGRYVVAQARAHDLKVHAIVRSPEKVPSAWKDDKDIVVSVLDLATAGEALSEALAGVGAVIHCAAAMAGDHARDTLKASDALIHAVVAAQVPHVVLAGSLSVYDVGDLPNGAALSETCTTGTDGRDAYAQAKLAQEGQFQDGASLYGFALSVLRLGAVWGPGQLYNAHIGPAFGTMVVTIDGGGEVPLCHVTLAADMMVRAAQMPAGAGVINILDDDRPDRRKFMSVFRKCGWPKRALCTPLWPWRCAAMITPNGDSMPGLLRRPILEARHRPLHYSNALMHKRLGPVTIMPFDAAMQSAIDEENKQADPS